MNSISSPALRRENSLHRFHGAVETLTWGCEPRMSQLCQLKIPDCCSRRARAVDIWAALKSMGRQGLSELVERNCRQAHKLGSALHQAGIEVLNDVVLNQVVVSFGSDRRTNKVIAKIQDEGECWCGGTVWHGRAAMRISISSWATTDNDIERSLSAILRAAQAP